jgi:hypothetical protein
MSSTEVNFSLSLAGFDIVIRVRCTTLTSACMLNFLMGACTVKCQKISLSLQSIFKLDCWGDIYSDWMRVLVDYVDRDEHVCVVILIMRVSRELRRNCKEIENFTSTLDTGLSTGPHA